MEIDPIWMEHQDKLFWFIHSRVSNECDAKDLLQEIFLKVKTRCGSLRDKGKVRSWIYQIGRNAIVDYYRGRDKRRELPEDLPEIKKAKDPWALISRCVRPFIQELPVLYREALILSEIEGLPHAEVARKLGISLSSAKARILRGKRKLKEKFDDCCIFECGPRGAKIHSDNFEKEG